jgi:hypothetical protein
MVRATIIGALAGLAAIPAAAACAASADGGRLLATVSRPAIISLQADPAGGGWNSRSIVISVHEFRPSANGPVQIVVEEACGGSTKVLGRFGVYPHRAFSEDDPARAQHFRAPVPPGSCVATSGTVRVRIVPSQGNGAGALAKVDGRLVTDS